MQGFYELLRQSVLVQATIALCCVGAVIYLAVTGQDIPDLLTNITMAVLGFYFGSKTQYMTMKGG